jgi:hypothetical protein
MQRFPADITPQMTVLPLDAAVEVPRVEGQLGGLLPDMEALTA